MARSAMVILLLGTLAGIAGCASRSETVGTAGDAAAGYGLTGGSGLGTAAGGVVGYEAGKAYDEKHNK